MSDEEFATELGQMLNYNRDEISNGLLALVKRKLEAEKLIDAKELTKILDESRIVHTLVRTHFKSWVENEIGNRLRCGIYDGGTVNRLFDSIWTEQFDIAIKERIRERVNKAIDAIVKERLNRV